MVQHGLALTLSLISSIVLCQASSFVYEDVLAYPRYKLELTEKKIPESSVFGQHQPKPKQIGQWNTQSHSGNDHNQVIMMTANSQPFLCTIPDITNQQKQQSSTSTNTKPEFSSTLQETQHTIERGLELLKPLAKGCLYFQTYGYWTYEYCHLKHVRQFHVDASKSDNDDKPILDEKSSYILGSFPQQQASSSSSTNDDSDLRGTHSVVNNNRAVQKTDTTTTTASPSATLRRIDGQHVLVQHWGNGTPCDITNQPRAIDIQFQCGAESDRIAFFEEVSTCHYRMTISTPRLCDDLLLGTKKESESHPIECNPIVPEHGITDYEQQQQQDESTTMTTTTTDSPLTETTTGVETRKQSQDEKETVKTTPASTEPLDETELVGMISNLAKQVEQLQRSMEQQYSMDQLLQQNHVFFLDQNGQMVLGPGASYHDPLQQTPLANKESVTPQALIKQLLLGSASAQANANKRNLQQQSPPPLDGAESQKQNKKAYEKNYYSLD